MWYKEGYAAAMGDIQSRARKAAKEIVENRDNIDSMYLGVEEITDIIDIHFSEGGE